MSLSSDMDTVAPPLFFFFPGIGEGEAKQWEPFGHVVRLIPLSYLDWTELVKPEATLADLIANLKWQIQNQLPVGPIHLVGYSIGGALAYGCALALQSEGRVVNSLAILDGRTYGPPPTTLRERWEHFTTFRLLAGLASVIAKLMTRERALPLLRRLSPLRSVELPGKFGTLLHSKLKMQLMGRMFPSWWHEVVRPSSEFPIPTFLFRSDEQHPWESEDFGWGNYCRNLKVIPVEGSHMSILAPENLGLLCAELAQIFRGGAAQSVAVTGSSTPSR